MVRSVAFAASLLLLASTHPGWTQSASLEGSWSGTGSVSFSSGAQERARCRVHYSKRSATSYGLNAVCATQSAKAEQTASIHETGPNRFEGRFYNSEYSLSGTVHIVVNGRSQTVTLDSDAGSARFDLTR